MAAMKHANRCSLFPLRASLLILTLGAANDRKWRFKIISGRSLYDRNHSSSDFRQKAAKGW
jgi:hypothetical protein